MNGSGPLDFEATIDAKTFNSMLDEMERRLKGVGSTAVQEGNKMDDAFRNAAAAMTAYFSVGFAKNAIKEIGQIRGEFQQLEIAFETMLRNKALSDKLMSEIVSFAAKTPFDLKGVAAGAKQLLAYGTSANDIIPTMRRLGDIAAGLSIPFGDLVYLYGTSATQGRIMTKDLMQFAGRGIPVIDELSKILNVSKAQIMELASQGALSFEHLQKVIENLTSETGMFGGMMDKQSKSITGLASNLGDAWDKMLNNIGEANQTTFEDGIKLAIRLTENYETIIDILKVLIATVGVYKAAVILNTIAIEGYNKALKIAIIHEKLLALAQKANPWGLALAGITALVGAVYAYSKAMDNSAQRMEEFNNTVNDSVASSNLLFDQLKKTTTGTEQRKAAIEKLQSKYGDYLTNINLEKAGLKEIEEAQKLVNDQIVRRIALEEADKEKEVWYKKELGYIKAITDAGYDYAKIQNESKNPQFNQYGQRIFVSYGQQVDSLLAGLEEINRQKKSIDEYYSNIVESLSVGPTATKKESTNETIEKDKKTFAQHLSDIKGMYDNYYKWAEHYGEESAGAQFASLLKGGSSYLVYLDNEIKKLEGRKKKSAGDTSNLSALLTARDNLTGVEGGFGNFEKMIGDAKDRYKELADYIEFLNSQIDSTPFDGSELAFQKIQLLFNELNKAEKDLITSSADTYNELKKQSDDFANRRLVVEKEYVENVKKLDRKSLGEEKYNEAVAIADKIKAAKLAAIKEEEVKSGEAYKAISGQIEGVTRVAMKGYLDQLKLQLQTLDKQSDLYKQLSQLIKETEKGLKNQTVDDINKIASGFRDASALVRVFDEDLANVVDSISNVASGIARIMAGDVVGGGLQVLTSIFTAIIDSSDRAAKKAEERQQQILGDLQERLANINTLLERQIALIDQLSGTDKLKGYADSFRDLRKEIIGLLSQIDQIDIVEKMFRGTTNVDLDGLIRTYKEVFGSVRPDELGIGDKDIISRLINENNTTISKLYDQILNGDLSGDQVEQLKLLIEQLEQTTEQYEQLVDQYNEYLTGTTVASITESIVSGFEEGKFAAEDFAGTFEDLMKKAMLQALKMKALEIPLQKWYEDFAAMAEDGLSTSDIEALRSAYDLIVGNASDQWKELQEILNEGGVFPQSENSLSGAIKGVSEETAGLIAGYMNSVRINQAQALVTMNSQLLELSRIEFNTRNNAYIKRIYDLLESSNNNTINSSRSVGGQ